MPDSDQAAGERKSFLPFSQETIGKSVRGIPIEASISKGRCRVLIVAGIHGEEPETGVILSRALRCLKNRPRHISWVINANPDGILLGTRGNANGIDLNRNFPTHDWQAEPVHYRWHMEESAGIEIGTGSSPASEPEATTLISLVETVQPDLILTLHAPLGCIDDPNATPTGKWLESSTGLPLIQHIGYPTPGSFGTWAIENGIDLITWEFPRQSIEELSQNTVPVLAALMQKEGKVGS